VSKAEQTSPDDSAHDRIYRRIGQSAAYRVPIVAKPFGSSELVALLAQVCR